MTLDELARTLLPFEASHLCHSGAKEEAIRAELGMTPARYYQLLDRAIDTDEAARFDPILVHRLRRLRHTRARDRAARLRTL